MRPISLLVLALVASLGVDAFQVPAPLLGVNPRKAGRDQSEQVVPTSPRSSPGSSFSNGFNQAPCYSSSVANSKLYGIPKMFRWLTDQYPTVNRKLSEGLTR